MKQILVSVNDKDFDTFVVMQYYMLVSDVEKEQYPYNAHPFNNPSLYNASEIESVIFIGVSHRDVVHDLDLYRRLQEEGIAVTVIGRYIDTHKLSGMTNLPNTLTLICAEQSRTVKATMTTLVANYYNSDNLFDTNSSMKLAKNLVEVYYNRKDGFFNNINYDKTLPYAIDNYLNAKYNPNYTLKNLLTPFWHEYYIPQLDSFNNSIKYTNIETTTLVHSLDTSYDTRQLKFNVITGDFRDTDWITGISDLANSELPLVYIQFSTRKVEARIFTMNSGIDVLTMAKELFPEVSYVGGSKNVAYAVLSESTKYINDVVFFHNSPN